MKTLYEGILSDMDDVLSSGDDEVMKAHILDQLHNQYLYWYNTMIPDKDAFIIKKKGNKWIVDLKTNFACYGATEYITDGTFEFGVAARDFTIHTFIDYEKPTRAKLKSLKYGPKLVNNKFSILGMTNLKNLRYCPKKVIEDIVIGETGITTLKYFPEYCRTAEIVYNKKLKDFDIQDVAIKSCVRLMNNGFESTKAQVRNSKCKFIDDYPIIICDE